MPENIDDYSSGELLAFLGLQEQQVTEHEVTEAAAQMIAKLADAPSSTDWFAGITFVKAVEARLVEEMRAEAASHADGRSSARADDSDMITSWGQNEYSSQSDLQQADLATSRDQKVEVFDAPAFPMERQRLGVRQSHAIPIVQGTINPTLRNERRVLVHLSSRYEDSTTDRYRSGHAARRPSTSAQPPLIFEADDTSPTYCPAAFSAQLSQKLADVTSMVPRSVSFTIAAVPVGWDPMPLTYYWNVVAIDTDGGSLGGFHFASPRGPCVTNVTKTSTRSDLFSAAASLKYTADAGYVIDDKGDALAQLRAETGVAAELRLFIWFDRDAVGNSPASQSIPVRKSNPACLLGWASQPMILNPPASFEPNQNSKPDKPQHVIPTAATLQIVDHAHNQPSQSVITGGPAVAPPQVVDLSRAATAKCRAGALATAQAAVQNATDQDLAEASAHLERLTDRLARNGPTAAERYANMAAAPKAVTPGPVQIPSGLATLIVPPRSSPVLPDTTVPVHYERDALATVPRDYFGPVNIEKLDVAIRDNKGNTVMMPDGGVLDVVIEITQLYQY